MLDVSLLAIVLLVGIPITILAGLLSNNLLQLKRVRAVQPIRVRNK